MSVGFFRSRISSRSFQQTGQGRTTPLHGVFVGFIKDNDDKARMGRLLVWIPELGGEPTDKKAWFQCSYASPFAGASSIKNSKPGGDWTQSQTSYGFWFVPPDLENEVLVCFANGDPGRGYWFACLYQWGMNHMVPGIPGNNGAAGTPPVVEYNKLNTSNINMQTPDRPIFTPLYNGLKTAGLDKDALRGSSDAGARRNKPINNVYGILSPGGNQFVMEDNPANPYIRLRTRTGAQIMINDSDGSIYMSSGGGKHWIGLNTGGTLEIYGYQDISIRSNGTINMRADVDINLEAGRNINVKARNDSNATPTGNSVTGGNGSVTTGSTTGGLILMHGIGDVSISSSADMFVRSDRDFHKTAKRDIYDLAYGNIYTSGHVNVFTTSGGNIYVDAKSNILMAGEVIHLNGPPVPPAIDASDATEPSDNIMRDNNVADDGVFKFINRNSILGTMPYHEPFEYWGAGGSGSGTQGQATDSGNVAIDPATGQPYPSGATSPNQTSPTNLVGTPQAGMTPGNYTGQGYNANGTAKYSYSGDNKTLKAASSFDISANGLEFLKAYEALKTHVYDDGTGGMTIGYGHLLTSNEKASQSIVINGTGVPYSGGLSTNQVDALFHQDVQKYVKGVQQAVKAQVNQVQFDAMVSLCYNMGVGGFRGSKVCQYVNAGNFDAATNAFMSVVTSHGQVLQGLVKRRRAEANGFRGTTNGLVGAH